MGASWNWLNLAIPRRWRGFTFVMHMAAAQKRHPVEHVLLEPFKPKINDRRHKERDKL